MKLPKLRAKDASEEAAEQPRAEPSGAAESGGNGHAPAGPVPAEEGLGKLTAGLTKLPGIGKAKELGKKVKPLKPLVDLDPLRPTLLLPKVEHGYELVEERVVREGLCVTRLLFNEARGIHLYQILEPELEGFEQEACCARC
jgi:hypothetical protein